MQESTKYLKSTSVDKVVSRRILFFDSGIGGIPYLIHARENYPDHKYVYLADNAFFPFGEKSEPELLKRILNIIEKGILRFKPEVIVIACNTASVIALDALREKFQIPFVGTVPAMKPAALGSTSGEVAVLATTRTIEDHYLQCLIRDFASKQVVHKIASAQLASLVEMHLLQSDMETKRNLDDHLHSVLSALIDTKTDSLVLGCTHFIHAKEEIAEKLGNRITIYDSRAGISRQMERLVLKLEAADEQSDFGFENNEKENLHETFENCFFLTEIPNHKSQQNLLKLLNSWSLDYGGLL